MLGSRATHSGGGDVAAGVSLQAILDCVAVPVWVVDHDGRVVLANPAALATLGYDDVSELQGRNGHDTVHYMHPDGSPYPGEDCPVLETRRSGRPVRVEEDWFFRRDGTMFPVSYTAVPLDLPTGRGVVTTFVDMTAQRQAEQALRERDAILARVAQPVWVVDHRGRFHYANPAALAALGYDDFSELAGRPGHQTVHYKYPDGTPFPEEDCPVAQARWSGQTHQEVEDWLVRKDGSILRIAYSTAPFELPDGLGAVTAFTDIEAHLEAERVKRERDVAEARAAELRAASRRIIEAADHARAQLTRDLHDGAQQQFVSAMLTLQMAERRAADDPDAAARLRRAAMDQARQGIADLRDLAAGLHPGILTDRGLVAAVQALAARLPLPVSVAHDLPRRLPGPVEASVYFFISEALTNVVKHARALEARVAVRCEADRLLVEVDDDGVGGATRARHGTGLAGLADRIAALDGELTVTSPPGEGTTLRAEIPLR
ncbi:MAG TPA: PAS domain-containing protein [Solirubrobacteraceae bacterium]|nr:PAS domain-containing protein [Solirubrobacteraceae bacterium]